jgi:ABC-type glycerol-3-phosphate transport system substrate-binding protein
MNSFRQKYGHTDDKYLPNQWEHFRAPDGIVYAAPFYNETRVLFYRTDMFEKHGLTRPPENFEELVQYGLTLSNGDDRFGMAHYDSWLDVHQFTWLLAAKGATIMNDDFTECTLDQPLALEALRFYKSLYDQNIIPKFPNKRVEGFRGFREGYYAMAESGAWWFGLLADAPEISGKWTSAVLPRDATTTAYGHPNPWFVPINAANQNGVNREAAEAWLNFMLTAENSLAIHQVGGFMPPMLSAYSSPIITENPNAMALYEAGRRGTYSLRNVPNAQMIQELIWTMLSDVRDDIKTPEQASRDVTVAINRLLTR